MGKSILSLALAIIAAPFLVNSQDVSFTSPGNPILGDGTFFSADPAPLAVGNEVYILAGRDEAPTGTNAFVMNEWQIFQATNPDPKGGSWKLHRNVARPESIFKWATSGGAYASQIVKGPDGKYYLYACAQERNGASDPFAVGVAVSSSPTGPFTDAHPSGPIISQRVPSPGNSIQNIDPTVLVDNGRVFIYWGSFGNLYGYELGTDMITVKGSRVTVTSLTGYFEAPWLMKRGSTYYMLYAANNAGTSSPCTPTSYHACIAYGTATNPLGPWTFRSVILPIVSSTTSHPGVYNIGDNYYLVYHTADSQGGGHFRRSVAFDKLEFDDSKSPPTIRTVQQTWRSSLTAPRPASRNIAPLATTVESANGTPIQYWIAALNDERLLSNPLPPDYWCSWADTRSPATNTLTYTWAKEMELNGVAISFFTDQPAGSSVGVPPPKSWVAQYQDSSGSWKSVTVTSSSGYPTAPTLSPPEVKFQTVKTKKFRVVLQGSGGPSQYGAVGIHEWYAYAPTAV